MNCYEKKQMEVPCFKKSRQSKASFRSGVWPQDCCPCEWSVASRLLPRRTYLLLLKDFKRLTYVCIIISHGHATYIKYKWLLWCRLEATLWSLWILYNNRISQFHEKIDISSSTIIYSLFSRKVVKIKVDSK